MKEIKIPYEMLGRRRTVCFNDVKGYKKIVLSSRLNFTVTYSRGDKHYIFSCEYVDYVSCRCIDAGKYDEKSGVYYEYDIEASDVRKFIRFSSDVWCNKTNI